METRLRTLITVVLLFVMCAGFSQRMNIPKPHFDEHHQYLICPCSNKLAKSKLAKDKFGKYQHTHAGVICTLYEYEKCSKCGKIWIWHNRTPKSDDFTLKTDKIEKLHKAVEDSCYSVEYFPVPSQGLCECTIKLKLCDRPLYCTVEGETGIYIVEKGYPATYCENTGKEKKVYVTHEKPEGTLPVRGYHK